MPMSKEIEKIDGPIMLANINQDKFDDNICVSASVLNQTANAKQIVGNKKRALPYSML